MMTDIESVELARHEATIERGLRTFTEVGNALLAIRDGRLYQAEYGTFEEYCQQRWQLKRQRAYQLMEAAEVAANVSQICDTHPVRESHAAALAELPAEQQGRAWQEAAETAPNGHVTAAHVQNVVNGYKAPTFRPELDEAPERDDWWDDEPADVVPVPLTEDGRIDARQIVIRPEPTSPQAPESLVGTPFIPDYDGDEWYTPAEYIAGVREVMGRIDLDPASCQEAQKIIQAGQFFTKLDDGLRREWLGRVWLNPPYSYPLVSQFVEHLLNEYEVGRVTAAILLTNNCTDAAWFHKPLGRFPVCFTRGRVSFWRSDRTVFATRQGQAFFYLGPDPDTFSRVFTRFGVVLQRLQTP